MTPVDFLMEGENLFFLSVSSKNPLELFWKIRFRCFLSRKSLTILSAIWTKALIQNQAWFWINALVQIADKIVNDFLERKHRKRIFQKSSKGFFEDTDKKNRFSPSIRKSTGVIHGISY